MTQKNKELLLKDLCMRLPYGVQLRIDGDEFPKLWRIESDAINGYPIDRFEILPYLRPMNSMTKEEKVELEEFGLGFFSNGKYKDEDGNKYFYGKSSFQLIPDIETYDWLNANHFDFRGLIEKGLAIEVNESNNHYKY